MSANPQELFAASAALGKLNGSNAYRSERRKRVRTSVHWAICLFQSGSGEAVETITRDLSSNGFYCLSSVPFECGDVLICSLQIPTHEWRHDEGTLALECKAKVVRSEPAMGEGLCGIACQIEDYRLSTSRG